jgi:hypothetical protein
MSKATSSQEKADFESLLASFLGKCSDVLENGTHRINLIRKIDRLINRSTDPDKLSAKKGSFLKELVRRIHGMKVYSVGRCSLFVYRMWERLDPHKENQELLKSIVWYTEPNRWRLEMDYRRSGKPWDPNCKSDYNPSEMAAQTKNSISPVKESKSSTYVRRIVVKESTVESSSRGKRSSLVRDEENEMRARIISRRPNTAIAARNLPNTEPVVFPNVLSTVKLVNQPTSSTFFNEPSDSNDDFGIGPFQSAIKRLKGNATSR